VDLSWFEDLTWLEDLILYGILGRLQGLGGDVLQRRIHSVALRGMQVTPTDNILELGFGSGGLIRMFAAAAPRGFIAGVDPSHLMWEIARRRNAAEIREQRVDLRVCEPTLLPWQEGRFDKAIAINSFRLWPAPLDVLRGLRRVLRPGAALVMTLRGESRAALDALKRSGFAHGEVVGSVEADDILIALRA
jgi:ubiquinone/menaquinone biosynthesis C-methylase UbiE